MKKNKITIWGLIPLFLITMAIISCSKNDAEINSSLIVSITDFSPKRAEVGTEITITGKNFDPVSSNNTVKINGMVVAVVKASITSLNIIIPVGVTSGKITVTTKSGTAVSIEDLDIIIPKIINIKSLII